MIIIWCYLKREHTEGVESNKKPSELMSYMLRWPPMQLGLSEKLVSLFEPTNGADSGLPEKSRTVTSS